MSGPDEIDCSGEKMNYSMQELFHNHRNPSDGGGDESGHDSGGGFNGDEDALRLLQQLAAEQSQLLEQLNVANSSATNTSARPSEQFLTIATNGKCCTQDRNFSIKYLCYSSTRPFQPDICLMKFAYQAQYWKQRRQSQDFRRLPCS